MGVGVFVDFIIDALRLTKTEISTAYMIGTIANSLILPFAGRLLDQIGSRAMVVPATLGLGGSLIILSQSDKFIQFIGLNSFLLTMIFISFVFSLMRFFGQCLSL